MKKLIAILAILAMASVGWSATATWDVTGEVQVVDGFTLRWWDTAEPTVQWNMTAPSGAARSMNLLDGWFMPGHEYTFEVEAYNGVGKSDPSAAATFVVSQPAYVAPDDSLPPEIPVVVPPDAPEGMVLDSVTFTFERQ